MTYLWSSVTSIYIFFNYFRKHLVPYKDINISYATHVKYYMLYLIKDFKVLIHKQI